MPGTEMVRVLNMISKYTLSFLFMLFAGCASLPPNYSADELKHWAEQKLLVEEFALDKSPRGIYNAVVPCLVARYRHNLFNNRNTYTDMKFSEASNSGYFSVDKDNDHIYIELLEILPGKEESSNLRFYGFDRQHLERLITNTFHTCKLSGLTSN